jgi:hypothetical protein
MAFFHPQIRVSVGEDHMNLVEFGTILCSCFGDGPNEAVRDILLNEYALDLESEDSHSFS